MRRLKEVHFLCLYLCLLVKADVIAVTPCTNRVSLIDRLLFRTEIHRHFNATSFVSPYYPYEGRIPRIGWCSNDLEACNNIEGQYIEVDFGDEVIVEAVAVLRAGGSCVKQYYVQYAGSDGEFHCASERTSNSTVFNENGVCYLEEIHIDFTFPVVARYVRIVPIQWIGISICLTMEIYGCTIRECPNFNVNNDKVLKILTTSLNDSRLFNITHHWCANDSTPQNISLNFTELVYMTRLRVRGSSFRFRILVNANKTLYSDINGVNEFSVSLNIATLTIPLWPAVKITYLEFQVYSTNNNPICLAIELSGCPNDEVIDHAVEESANSSTPVDGDTTEMCKFAPTSMCFISPSTSCQPVVTISTTVPNFTMFQQNKVSGDDCNVAAIVVPIVLVIIASTVVICIVIFMAVRYRKKTGGLDLSTTKKDEIICVVKNDLYESQDVTSWENSSKTNDIDSSNERPYSPTASDEHYAQIREEDGNATDTIQYDYPEEPSLSVDDGPTTDYELVDIPTAAEPEGNETQPVSKVLHINPNPSYEAIAQ